MRHFTAHEVKEAIRHAASGGQALHTHRNILDWNKAPVCFKREVREGRDIANLFDQDQERLKGTARRLGVRVILVEREGKPGQHIDLCAGPLRKALALCEKEEYVSDV